jgi:hypothetical protein
MSFERELSILAEVEDEITNAGRKLGINIDRRVVMETPRDTGSAKASWLVSVNQPDNTIVDKDGEDVGTAELQAIQAGAAKAKLFTSGDTLYIQNNQPYIDRLNEGWSAQAGSGYIDAIINEEVRRAD